MGSQRGKSMEVIIMEYLKDRKAKEGFPQLISHGLTDMGHEYIIMNQLGPNLKIMQRQVQNKFSLRTVI